MMKIIIEVQTKRVRRHGNASSTSAVLEQVKRLMRNVSAASEDENVHAIVRDPYVARTFKVNQIDLVKPCRSERF